MIDIIVIGAGVSGCAIARELSRKKANVLVVEREEDVCCGTSKANSAIVHAGYDAKHGSLMAKLNVQGSRMMPGLAKAKEAYREADRRKALELAVSLLRPGDALLVAGKGHEDYQIIGTTKHHFSDQEILKELISC